MDIYWADFVEMGKNWQCCGTTVLKKGTSLRSGILIWTFFTFWVRIGSLFIFQCPGFIHVENVNFFKNKATRKHIFINHWSVKRWVKCGIVMHVISEIVVFGAFLYFLCLWVNFLYLPFLGHLFFLGPYQVPIS